MPQLVAPALPADCLSSLAQPTLQGDDGVVLRQWQPADAATVTAAFGEAGIQRWHMRRIDSRNEALSWLDSWRSRWLADTDASWAGTRDGVVVGWASLRELNPAHATGQISYWTLPSARGTGVATAGARTVTRWAIATLGLHRVFLTHSTSNVASCRVAVRAGFSLEGTLRGYMLHADGWNDVHMHARLATDH